MKKMYKGHSFLGGLVLCILLFAGFGVYALYIDNLSMAMAELGLAVLLSAYVAVTRIMRKRDMDTYMSMIIESGDTASHNALTLLPLPMVVLSVDGQIMWYNDLFVKIVDEKGLYNTKIFDIIEDIRWTEILKSETILTKCTYNGCIYELSGKILRKGEDISILLYFRDISELLEAEKKNELDKTVIGIVAVDNYDDLFSKLDDVEAQQAATLVNSSIISWVEGIDGIIKRLERDRFLVMFENRQLPECIAKKFNVLEKVRSIGEQLRMPISVSIGIGRGESLIDSEKNARAALDMAQSRGGDQTVIRDEVQFSFYGGKTREYEKSTRVKTRAFATAFKDFIANSDAVYFMGHASADYDCFGAAVGLSRACRNVGKNAYIIYDNSPAVEPLASEMRKLPEYNGMLISAQTALENITSESLLVILDTHRPSMLPDERLLGMTEKVVLIDHHRRSTEFLPHTALLYHEPYASSACEIAAEVLQYIDEKRTISSFETKALYIGILMDTKNFMVKTGVRTFEAASYLRKCGLDPIEVKKFFAMEKNEYMYKVHILDNAEVYEDSVAIAYTDEKYANMRVVSSIACDELLNIKGMKAAFVVYISDGEAYVSARSVGDINVQLICEKLGGGGHITIAGAKLKGMTVDEARLELKAAISEYIEENKSDN